MVELKYKARRFGEMGDDERFVSACGLMIKISATTGWLIPNDKTVFDVFADQFSKKLGESYANANVEEFEYAFRNNTSVKDWGKAMNLSLIDEVMIPYLEKRFGLSEVEERIKTPPMIEYKEDLSDQSFLDWFESVSGDVLAGKLKLDFLPPMIYDWMDGRGEINKTGKEKREYLEKAAAHRQSQLAQRLQDTDNAQTRKTFDDFCTMYNRGFFEGNEIKVLKDLAKRMILFDLIVEKQK